MTRAYSGWVPEAMRLLRVNAPMPALAIGIACFFFQLGAASASSASPWGWTYANARFCYTVAYPPDLLRPQPEAENGDGRRFISKDGQAVMAVWGRWKMPDPDDSVAMASKQAAADLTEVTYQVTKANWFVVSGYDRQGRIFYEKMFQAGGKWVGFDIVYPVGEKRTYDGVTGKIARSLRPDSCR